MAIWRNGVTQAANNPCFLILAPDDHQSVIDAVSLQAGMQTPVPPSPQYPPGFFAKYCW